MKTIGLIGGMSWESTTSYYQIINETIKKELGGLHSAKILLYSVDFAEIEHYQAKVGLLGTKYTMTQDFYKEKLIESGLEVLIPDQAGITEVNRIIYDELCLGDIKESSKQTYLAVINDLKKAGAEAVILGCTEIGLLIKQFDIDLPLYDTTVIHAEKAAEWAVNK